MTFWRRPSGAQVAIPSLTAALQQAQIELAGSRVLEAELRAQLMTERARADRLIEQLLELRREGFNPPPRVPEPVRRERAVPMAPAAEGELEGEVEDPVRAWQRIMGAIQDRAGDNPPLRAKMEIDCRRWRQSGMATEQIITRVLHGWDGD